MPEASSFLAVQWVGLTSLYTSLEKHALTYVLSQSMKTPDIWTDNNHLGLFHWLWAIDCHQFVYC